MYTRPHILITGATGFIGSHLTELLLAKGFRVTAIARNSGNTGELSRAGVTVLQADITKMESLERIFQQLRTTGAPDYVIHAAALTKAPTENELMKANCLGTENLLFALKTFGLIPKKFIFISSLAAAGPQHLGGIIHTDQASPVTQYGKSKLQAEAIIRSYAEIPHLILRPTAVYGPREKDLFAVFKLVNRRMNPVIGSHEQELTFVFVKDLAELIIAAMENSKKNETYFVTDGYVYTKTALAAAIGESLNKKSRTIRIPLFLVRAMAFFAHHSSSLVNRQSALSPEKYRELTAPSWNCDMDKTFSELNYTPRFDLRKGVKETVQWYKENKWI
jgi:nucleoside-diphosphate-sugar epimerase